MNYSGRAKGEKCKYREFVYRIPIREPISIQKTEMDLTPTERYINALAGIDMEKVNEISLKTQEIFDYEFEIEFHDKYLVGKVNLFLIPNEYTLAKNKLNVGEWSFFGPDFHPWYTSNYKKTIEELYQLDALLKQAVLY